VEAFNTDVGTPCAACAYEQRGLAVVLLDCNSQILRMNAAAERLLGSDYKIVSKRLCSVYGRATAALNLVLQTFIGSNEPASVIPSILLPRSNSGPMVAHALPPCQRASTPCKAVLVLIDLSTRDIALEFPLRTAFGLSKAEARLAQHLASGESLEDSADQIGISKHTARVQLKAIFAKMSVHRQGELVALLTRLTSLPIAA
jgi:DNA-binding CsgD family transcriptional regulator